MAKAEILAGICGFKTTVETSMDGPHCNISIKSDCESIQSLAEALGRVDPYQEISFRRSMPLTYQMASKYCAHAACPVASGIIKAIEVEARLALPADVAIKISK
jgi:hypothetical protein